MESEFVSDLAEVELFDNTVADKEVDECEKELAQMNCGEVE